MKILAITAEMPFPPIGGGLLRTYHWLHALASEHEVTLVAFTFDQESYSPPPFPINIVAVPWKLPPLYREMESDDPAVAERAFEILRKEVSEPWYASYFASAVAEETIQREVAKGADLALIEDSDMGRFLSLIPAEIPKVLDLQNVYSLMSQRVAEGKSGEERRLAQQEANRTLAFERSVAAQCDLCLACSEKEADAVKNLLGVNHVAVLANGVDTTYFAPTSTPPNPGTLLFTGSMNYPPNLEAVTNFVTETLSKIVHEKPNTVLHVVGKEPPEHLQQLRSEHVVIHGRVPDVRPYFADAEIVVAPVLSGGGTRFKILEAAASGKPIVTTKLGAEGLDFEDQRHLIIVDQSAAFAQAVVGLLGDAKRQGELGQNARHASKRYDWKKIGDEFRDLIKSPIARCQR